MTSEHFDVIVVGAGLSGIGAGYRLQTQCPGKSYAILEARERMGGTWDLFRYPGVRSDSDMFTLGFQFKPWQHPQAIADGTSIRAYIEETAHTFGIDRKIRFGHKVRAASWDSATATWTVDVDLAGGSGSASYTCNFLYMCSGYYSYDAGYTPDFPAIEDFAGTVVHPQHWPDDLDYAGKKVVVIGSGATAVTLIPSMADTAEHVTMLQRSPAYILSLPGVDPLAAAANRLLPTRFANRLSRLRSVVLTQAFYQFCTRWPAVARRVLAKATAAQLPEGYPIDPDFAPRYNPWDERMCIVPDGDLFASIRSGKASVVTSTIEHFDTTGIVLSDGRHLDADVVVTATGLQLEMAGGAAITVDGTSVKPASRYVYRGCMLSGVPNFALCVGYTNASWTLRADLSSQLVCKVIRYMADHGYAMATPRPPAGIAERPLLDLKSGYVRRAQHVLPKSGQRRPWRVRQNYLIDFFDSRFANVAEDVDFAAAPLPAVAAAPPGDAVSRAG